MIRGKCKSAFHSDVETTIVMYKDVLGKTGLDGDGLVLCAMMAETIFLWDGLILVSNVPLRYSFRLQTFESGSNSCVDSKSKDTGLNHEYSDYATSTVDESGSGNPRFP